MCAVSATACAACTIDGEPAAVDLRRRRPSVPGSRTPNMPIRGACAMRSSGAAGSIRPKPPKPGRPLVAASCAAVPGTTIQTTSARRTATGTTPTTGTTTSASGSPARFPPEPTPSRWRRVRANCPGPSMMRMIWAATAPIPASPSLETHGLRPAPAVDDGTLSALLSTPGKCLSRLEARRAREEGETAVCA